ncbi:MAG: cytochrome C oxidase subunit IV family protein [Vicingaceae bacterium]
MEEANKPYKYAVHHSEEEGKKIRKNLWKVFWILLVVTTVEVSLGIFWKQLSGDNSDMAWPVVKWIFISLTLLKAFYIVAEFMHLGHERKGFILTIMVSYTVLIIYFIYMILAEAIVQ